MAYMKIIKSGDLLEEWLFEREPVPMDSAKRKRSSESASTERRANNIRRCKQSFTRLVRANLNGVPALCTLTIHSAEVSISEAYRFYTRFGDLCRRKYGVELRMVGVPEFQKRGAVHFHILMWGLPETLPCILKRVQGRKKRIEVCSKNRPCERKVRALASLWPHGFVDLSLTDGSPKLSSYLAKYMGKAMHDTRLIGKRAYSASRNVLRPTMLNKRVHISIAYDLWGIPVDKVPVRSRTYDTLWLGRCDYKQFNV